MTGPVPVICLSPLSSWSKAVDGREEAGHGTGARTAPTLPACGAVANRAIRDPC